MGAFTTFALVLWGASSAPCDDARQQYESLSLEDALSTARTALEVDAARPLECLEVTALALLVLGREEEARAALTELFERDPSREIEDVSLAPAKQAFIDQTRAELLPLETRVTARWIVHESLRLDLVLDGGLRGAAAIRCEATLMPIEKTTSWAIDLEGRAATATVTVATKSDAQTLRVKGEVVDGIGRVVHRFSSELLLPERPRANEIVVEVDRGGGPGWIVWAVVGAAVVGSAVAVAVIAQPDLPGAMGVGRVEVPK